MPSRMASVRKIFAADTGIEQTWTIREVTLDDVDPGFFDTPANLAQELGGSESTGGD